MTHDNPLDRHEVGANLTVQPEEIDYIVAGIILRLIGDLDIDNSSLFQQGAQKIVENGYINIIFDCSAVNYISSSGIGAFVLIEKELVLRKGSMTLVGLRPEILSLFDLLGFHEHFAYKDTVGEAIADYCQDNTCLDEDGPDADEIFPLIFRCPACFKKQKTNMSGHFKCGWCKSVIAITEMGEAALDSKHKHK